MAQKTKKEKKKRNCCGAAGVHDLYAGYPGSIPLACAHERKLKTKKEKGISVQCDSLELLRYSETTYLTTENNQFFG